MATKELLNDFYKIITLDSSNTNIIKFDIELNPAHTIFKGHFETMPVVPGVCQLQIVKEIIEKVYTQKLQLIKGDNIKFTGMIVPTNHPKVSIEINIKEENNLLNVDSKLYKENTTFTKSKSTYKIIS